MTLDQDKLIIGSLEICDLPELDIDNLQVRIDTGAQTSSLHVDHLNSIIVRGKPWVEFEIHPDIHNVSHVIKCRSRVKDIRRVKSSNGESQQRYVIVTPIVLGQQQWPIEITLTDRSDMSYLMLLGREGMANRVLVDPSQTYLARKEP